MALMKSRALVSVFLPLILIPLGLGHNAALGAEGNRIRGELQAASHRFADETLINPVKHEAFDMLPAKQKQRSRSSASPSTITLNFALLVTDGERTREVSEVDRAEVMRAVIRVDEYYQGLSGGMLRVELGRIIGWKAVRGCDRDLLASSSFSDLEGFYEHVVMIKGCPNANAAGMADKSGTRIWLNNVGQPDAGTLMPISVRTLAHELGHNLGAGHAQTEDCFSLFFKMSCTREELATRVVDTYGDDFDLMGAGLGALLSTMEHPPVVGPMNPVLSARIGLPYRTVTINPRKLTAARTVTVEPRTADLSRVRAVRVRMSGQDVFFSLAANGVFDNYGGMTGDGSPDASPTLLAHARAYAYFPGGTFLLRIDPMSHDSGLAPGITFPIGKKALMRIDSVSHEGARLTFMPRPKRLVVSKLHQAPDGLTVRWTASEDPQVTGYRVRLLGSPKCADELEYLSCYFSGGPGGYFNTEVDVDSTTREFHFNGLNGGSLYTAMIVPLGPGGEGIGVASEPERATAQLPELELRAAGRTISVMTGNQGIYLAEAAYSVSCREGQALSGSEGLHNPDPFPILITVPADCMPRQASITVSGIHDDGRLFRTASMSVTF